MNAVSRTVLYDALERVYGLWQRWWRWRWWWGTVNHCPSDGLFINMVNLLKRKTLCHNSSAFGFITFCISAFSISFPPLQVVSTSLNYVCKWNYFVFFFWSAYNSYFTLRVAAINWNGEKLKDSHFVAENCVNGKFKVKVFTFLEPTQLKFDKWKAMMAPLWLFYFQSFRMHTLEQLRKMPLRSNDFFSLKL